MRNIIFAAAVLVPCKTRADVIPYGYRARQTTFRRVGSTGSPRAGHRLRAVRKYGGATENAKVFIAGRGLFSKSPTAQATKPSVHRCKSAHRGQGFPACRSPKSVHRKNFGGSPAPSFKNFKYFFKLPRGDSKSPFGGRYAQSNGQLKTAGETPLRQRERHGFYTKRSRFSWLLSVFWFLPASRLFPVFWFLPASRLFPGFWFLPASRLFPGFWFLLVFRLPSLLSGAVGFPLLF